MSRFLLPCALASMLWAACSESKNSVSSTEHSRPALPPPVIEKSGPNKAKLVLVVVLDQMPSGAFLRYAPHLPAQGVLRRAIDSGMFHERVRYAYAGTSTAPGHASIYTGELPADHGVDANDVFNYELGTRMRIISDGEHEIFGVSDAFASPSRLLKPTVGDRLHQESPKSKVISVSLKGRAAVVSGGKTADLVTWYNPKLPGFTTSSYYAETMPEWLHAWNQANPISERFAAWTAGNAKLYEKVNGLDDAPGEADWHGLGTRFPHDVAMTKKPSKVFAVTPQSVVYLLDMTRALVGQFQLGEDEHPDLLSVSISATDYAGHTFGVDSWEYLDLLIKTDQALTALVKELEAKTDLAVLVTSDHGGTSLAETSIAKGLPGGRLYVDDLVNVLEAKADKELGKGNWLQSYIQPYLYLHKEAKDSKKRDKLLALITRFAAKDPKIEAIYPAELARGWRNDENWLKRDVANSVAEVTEALFVVPAKGHVASPRAGTLGTGHGTPWDSDREVPVLAVGVGVNKSHSKDVHPQARVAATIAALLGLEWHLPAKPLSGARALPSTPREN